MKKNSLAYYGGKKVIDKKLSYRKLFGKEELKKVEEVFRYSWKIKKDFGFQEIFEDKFTKSFSKFMGGGYTDAVSSGGAALYIALKALNISKNSEIIISPVCNPGGIMPLAIQEFNFVIADSGENTFNVTPETFKKAISKKTKVAVLTHLGGIPVDVETISKICKKNKILLIEDCSQAHGAIINKKKVGSFGIISTFSTMWSKTLATGGCGGIIFTKKKHYYNKIRSIADRGKPFHNKNFNFKDTHKYLFPSLNFNSDEISCAIGSSILKKLPNIINKRFLIANKIKNSIEKSKSLCILDNYSKNFKPSFFFLTIYFKKDFRFNKKLFIKAIESEGVTINGNYKDIVSEWIWVKKSKNFRIINKSKNAINYRNNSFNLLFNENFSNKDIFLILKAILKVENYFLKIY
tara:strand:- start:7834 stop:9054 length:1221 start_codon:yes stop_codon:yes gene_type:complete